jgi:hypothetical protein
VVQVTPPGSGCSVGFGTGITAAEIGEVRHFDNGTWISGPHPDRGDYMSFAGFTDPDGNVWLLQETGRSKA